MRKWFRIIHRDLSFFFSGVILVYAISGIMLNQKGSSNPDYSIERVEFNIKGNYPLKSADFGKERVLKMLEKYGEEKNYTKHYFPDGEMKVFLKGGSSLMMDMSNGNGLYESVKRRPILADMNRLHYNPNRWWTIFSNIFAVALIIITITGLFMNRGKNGMIGRGGIELILGIIIPILFMFVVK